MPRQPRIYVENALYYITCKGNYNHNIFIDPADWQMFLELLKKYKEQYGFKLYAYALMSSHFHLLLELIAQREEQCKGGISEVMRDLNSSYTKYFNGQHGRKGHLFQQRFKATLVEKEPYLLKLSAYIHLNPEILNPSLSAQEYPYSSFGFYLGKTLPWAELIKGEKEEAVALLANTSYEEFVRGMTKESRLDLHKHLKKGALGSDDFKSRVEQAIADSEKKEEKTEAKKRLIPGKRLALLALALIIAGLGIAFALRFFFMPGARSISVQAASQYQLPGRIRNLLKELEDTEWTIRLVSFSGGPVRNDVIHFSEGRFSSRDLASKGYFPSEYSLIVEDDQRITWKVVMQQQGTQNRASWQGEIEEGRLLGTLSIRQRGLESRDFSFVSVGFRKKER